MTLAVLQELVHVYCDLNHFEFPPPNQVNTSLNRLTIFQGISTICSTHHASINSYKVLFATTQAFLKENINYMKAFIKSWLFELKAIRNSWAHMTTADFDIRMVCRQQQQQIELLILSRCFIPASQGIPSTSSIKKQNSIESSYFCTRYNSTILSSQNKKWQMK